MSTVLSPEAAAVAIVGIKARTKSKPGETRYIGLSANYSISCTYKDVKHATIPDLCWEWKLLGREDFGDQTLTAGEALLALQGVMPEPPMSGDEVFAMLARNSEAQRGWA